MTEDQRTSLRNYQGESPARKKSTEDMPRANRRRAVEEQIKRKADVVGVDNWFGGIE